LLIVKPIKPSNPKINGTLNADINEYSAAPNSLKLNGLKAALNGSNTSEPDARKKQTSVTIAVTNTTNETIILNDFMYSPPIFKVPC